MAGGTGAQNGARPAAMPMRLSGIAKLYRQSGLFTWQLRGGSRDSLRPGLQDPWKGNATRGSCSPGRRLSRDPPRSCQVKRPLCR